MSAAFRSLAVFFLAPPVAVIAIAALAFALIVGALVQLCQYDSPRSF